MTQTSKVWLYNVWHDNSGGVALITCKVIAESRRDAEKGAVKSHGVGITILNLEEGEWINDGEVATSEKHKPSVCEYKVRVGQAGVQTFIHGELLAYNLDEAKIIVYRRVKQLGKNYIALPILRWKR